LITGFDEVHRASMTFPLTLAKTKPACSGFCHLPKSVARSHQEVKLHPRAVSASQSDHYSMLEQVTLATAGIFRAECCEACSGITTNVLFCEESKGVTLVNVGNQVITLMQQASDGPSSASLPTVVSKTEALVAHSIARKPNE
jgi:hypothetical protein